MFRWLFKNRQGLVEDETKKAFSGVKKDMEMVGKWVDHLNQSDKQLFDNISELKQEISSMRDEIEGIREALHEISAQEENSQLFDNLPVLNKQRPVLSVEKDVQMPVQTADIFDFLKNLSANERLLIFTLMNSDMKLSYEDLALLLGKERSTIRGQINAIKQKSQGLIEEVSERNGKKRVYIPEEIKEKLQKYGKVRIGKKKSSVK
jgi:septal ring factor EnvC (AmiA/AmiB activator)